MSWKDDLINIRQWMRQNQLVSPTIGLAPGRVHANLVLAPKEQALDFAAFCIRNPRALPIVDILEAGRWEPAGAPGCDLRTDLPKYHIYHNGGLLAEVPDIRDYWRNDLVAFLLGSSFTFDALLTAAGLVPRHIELDKIPPLYVTSLPCKPAGPFRGSVVVSMRPIPAARCADVARSTARLPKAHGAPIQIGAPAALGIADLSKPEFGEPMEIREDETPAFWASSTTAWAVARASRLPFLITNAPGHTFLMDLWDKDMLEP